MADEISTTDLPVTGALPRELNGRCLRIGPNPIGSFGLDHHWFLGEGMVHGVRLRDGRAEWYRSRFVAGDDGLPVNSTSRPPGTPGVRCAAPASSPTPRSTPPPASCTLPVTVSPEAARLAPAAALQSMNRFPMRWNDDHASRVGMLPRRGDASQIRWFDAPTCYVFHVLNAFDNTDGSLTVDVVRYDSMFRDEFRAPGDALPGLARWIIDPARGTVTEQFMNDRSVEFPRVDPALTGLPYRYGSCAGMGADGMLISDDVQRFRDRGFETGPLVKIDTTTGEATTHDYGTGRTTMEPAFVPRPGARAEDDSWILSVVHDATTDRGELVVLDAADLGATPVARVRLPRRVPFGFHGHWIGDDELS